MGEREIAGVWRCGDCDIRLDFDHAWDHVHEHGHCVTRIGSVAAPDEPQADDITAARKRREAEQRYRELAEAYHTQFRDRPFERDEAERELNDLQLDIVGRGAPGELQHQRWQAFTATMPAWWHEFWNSPFSWVRE